MWLFSICISTSPIFSPCKCGPTVLVLARLNPVHIPLPHIAVNTFSGFTLSQHYYRIPNALSFSMRISLKRFSSFCNSDWIKSHSHGTQSTLQRAVLYHLSLLFFFIAVQPRILIRVTVLCTNQTENLQVIPWLLHHKTCLEIYPWSVKCHGAQYLPTPPPLPSSANYSSAFRTVKCYQE